MGAASSHRSGRCPPADRPAVGELQAGSSLVLCTFAGAFQAPGLPPAEGAEERSSPDRVIVAVPSPADLAFVYVVTSAEDAPDIRDITADGSS